MGPRYPGPGGPGGPRGGPGVRLPQMGNDFNGVSLYFHLLLWFFLSFLLFYTERKL